MEMNETWMKLAIAEALKCPEGVPRIGTVIVKDDTVIGAGYRGKSSLAIHAEHSAIEEAVTNGFKLKGSTLFTTLEPCSRLSGVRTSCAQRIIDAKIQEVFIGTYDRNPNVYRKGWKKLKEAGVKLKDFTANARDEAGELNRVFNDVFRYGVGMTGGAKFDYSQNGGRFEIFFDESKSKSRITTWTSRSGDSVYAYDGVMGNLALAVYADSFADIDDPDALDYESHSVPIGIKDIVVFRSEYAHVLIQVLSVEAGPSSGNENTSLKIRWEVRLRQK